MNNLKIAKSHNGKCFICGSKRKLKRINKIAIVSAYLNENVFIKNHARCCSCHMNERGLFKPNELKSIEESGQCLSYQSKFLMDEIFLSTVSSGIFDLFKDFSTISEEDCFNITRWNKKEFLNFSNFIKSTKDTNGRTKEQLIAIYRYWLRKGIDQASLAMFKNQTSQQQISHYLAQIRKAIIKDFVPHYLGANKPRDFFLKHNTKTIVELYDLEDEELAVVVDATYCRLEKSANNEFQYKCWSQQKMDLLAKPFIICCGDGYFIDCYGPFQANQNDSTIFEYILENDHELLKILEPNKTVIFLDRGRFKFNYVSENQK
jgi:hypothetical protein